jgi:hypothetical protein
LTLLFLDQNFENKTAEVNTKRASYKTDLTTDFKDYDSLATRKVCLFVGDHFVVARPVVSFFKNAQVALYFNGMHLLAPTK